LKIDYRPEIDGLRGIAVISAILYHAQISIFGINFFKGGYLGVDIFFVISGYLITSIIYKEIEITNKFSFKNFYERRVRRILPVLFFISIITAILCLIFLLPTDLVNTSKSILFSTGFASNFYFYFSGLEYGGLDANYKPFLHTWSLSVEEQYYLIFPLFFILVFKYSKKYLFNSLIIIFFVSLAYSQYGAIKYPNATFYFLHTRIWELIAGALLVFPKINNIVSIKKLRLNNFIILISFLLILLSIYFFDDYTTHPSFITLIPVLSTCLIILYSNKNSLVINFLSNKLLVNIGLMSYSLYLWHHPIFAVLRYRSYDLDFLGKILLALFIIVASYLTYKLIENPFRNKKLTSFSSLRLYLLSSFIIIIILNSFIIYNKGYPTRFFQTETFSLDNQLYKKNKYDAWDEIKQKNKFQNKEKNILVIGDSHGLDTFLILNEKYNNEDIGLSYIWEELYCLKNLTNQKFCEKDLTQVQKEKIKKADLIILSTSWIDRDIDNLDEILKFLTNMEKNIVIWDKTPFFKWFNFFSELDLYVFKNGKLPNSQDLEILEKNNFLSINKYEANVEELNNRVNQIALENDIIVFNKIDYVCNRMEFKCKLLTNNNRKIFYDNNHYTLAGIKSFSKKIEKLGWFLTIEKFLK
tara:strand:+ start:1774 stop:3693 length:1920 start_codon:yes stop_codon:yes gene_type:complete